MSPTHCELVAICGDPAFASMVATRVAEAASALWGDAIGVVHVVPASDVRPPRTIDGVLHAWITPRPPEALRRACAPWVARVARLLVTPSCTTAADRIVILGEGTGPVTHVPPLQVDLLPPDTTPPAAWPNMDLTATLTRGAVASCTARSRAGARETAPYPATPLARVRLDPAWTTGDAPFARLPPPARDSVARLARAITGRRVGVALGGAGAWGYTSVALMQLLAERGVPIDLVAGSSSGALAGAYYCVRGAEGLARLVARGPSFRRAMPLMALSSRAAEWAVDADLGGARIESLEALFLPVVTNLARMRAEVVTRGTVGFGVRASVSAPGVFAATRAGDGSPLVDGAVLDNVPVSLVEAAGADLTLASNALPPPRSPRSGRAHQFAAAFGALLHRAGERESGPRRVVFSADAAPSPLLRTFRYDGSARIAAAARHDPRVLAAVEALTRAWAELSRPSVLSSSVIAQESSP